VKFTLEIPIKKNDVIYTVENCKIEKYYVEGLEFSSTTIKIGTDISHCVTVNLERYKEPENSSKTQKRLSHCFLSKDELLSQL